MLHGRRVLQQELVVARLEHRVEPLVALPEVSRHVVVHVLDDGLLPVGEGAAADGGQDDGFGEGRRAGQIHQRDGFREEAHLDALTALKFLLGSWETRGYLPAALSVRRWG